MDRQPAREGNAVELVRPGPLEVANDGHRGRAGRIEGRHQRLGFPKGLGHIAASGGGLEILQPVQDQGGRTKTRKHFGALPDADECGSIALGQGGEDPAGLRQRGRPAGFARIDGPQAQGSVEH